MAQHAQRETDERFNQLSDRDAFWGPLLAFRPEKRRCISGSRSLAMAATLGGFYGMILNLALALIFRKITHQHLPSVLMMPAILTLTYWVAFQLTLGPAWNRRARLLLRREGYLASIGRPREEQ